MTNKWLAGYVLLSLLSIVALTGYAVELRSQRAEAQAAAATASLEADGWKKAAQATPKEVVKLVPQLVTKEVIRYIKEGVVQPVAAGTGSATSNVVEVPCPPTPAPQGQPFVVPALVKLKGSLLILDSVDGTALWKGELSGKLQSPPATQPVWDRDLTFDPANVDLNITVSDKIHKALAAYDQPWFKRHLRLQCPGLGVVYDPILRRFDAGIGCSYGLIW